MIDEKLLDELCGHLRGYFGDAPEEEALGLLRDDLKKFSETRQIFKDGLDAVLSDASFRCLPLVEEYANRYVEGSEEKARAWLVRLRGELFGRA